MENYQVVEVVYRYATIMVSLGIPIYILALLLSIKNGNDETSKWSILNNEMLIISRSLIIIYIAFIFSSYMFLVQDGAIEYFKINPTHIYSDFFKYIIREDLK